MPAIRPAPPATARMSAPSRADCAFRPPACQPRRPQGVRKRAAAHTSGVPTSGRRSRTRVEHRGVVVRTSRVGNACEPRRRAGRTWRGRLGGQAEMPEDPLHHGRLLDEGDQAQTAATPRTRQHIKSKGARHERRPTLTAGSPPRPLDEIRLPSLRGAHVLPSRIVTSDGRLVRHHLSPPGRPGFPTHQ